MAAEPNVEHQPDRHRFCIAVSGAEAVLDYSEQGGTLDLYHTFVPPALRGRGLAERLCKAAFEHAKAAGLKVVPSCSYVSGAYLVRHPEYRSLVQDSY